MEINYVTFNFYSLAIGELIFRNDGTNNHQTMHKKICDRLYGMHICSPFY